MEQATVEIQQALDVWYKQFQAANQNGKRKEGCSDHPGRLTIAFNDATSPVCHICQHRAPEKLERKTGFTGIAGRYTLPAGLKPFELENYALIARDMTFGGKMPPHEGLQRLNNVWNMLCARNPELGQVRPKPEDLMQVYHAILGVTSFFNPVDIHDFIHIGGGNVRIADPAYREKLQQIEGALGNLGWVPTMATMDTILLQLKNAPAPPPSYRPGL